jgi:hypothetical protein
MEPFSAIILGGKLPEMDANPGIQAFGHFDFTLVLF